MRVAIITGGSHGYGKKIAEELGTTMRVFSISRTHGVDLEDRESIIKFVNTVYETVTKLDMLVLCAATLPELRPIPMIDESEWDKTLSINLTANFILLKMLHPLLKAADNPHIVYFGSVVVDKNHPYWGAYRVSKSAMVSLMQTYAEENPDIKVYSCE